METVRSGAVSFSERRPAGVMARECEGRRPAIASAANEDSSLPRPACNGVVLAVDPYVAEVSSPCSTQRATHPIGVT